MAIGSAQGQFYLINCPNTLLNLIRNSCASHRVSLRHETRKHEVCPHGSSGEYHVTLLLVHSPHFSVFAIQPVGLRTVHVHREYVDSDNQM